MELIEQILLSACGLAVLFIIFNAYANRRISDRRIRSIVITGGASGIGFETAKGAIAAGIRNVVVLDVNNSALQHSCIALEEYARGLPREGGVRVLALVCDVSDPTSIQRVFKEIYNTIGNIDVVVSNAGVVVAKDVEELKPATLEKCFAVNTYASYYVAQEVLPAMKARRKGCIVIVSSVMGMIGSARLSAYVASKFALFGFAESLRLELARDGYHQDIPVITVCPYATRTRMFEGIFSDARAWNPIRDIFFPQLSATDVATSILCAINRWRNDLVVVPHLIHYVILAIRWLPNWAYDVVNGMFGGWHGMSGFRGHGLTDAG